MKKILGKCNLWAGCGTNEEIEKGNLGWEKGKLAIHQTRTFELVMSSYCEDLLLSIWLIAITQAT